MSRLYVATGDGVARLDEHSSGWTVELSLRGSGAQCLAVDPNRADVAYAGLRGGGLMRTEDGGSAWTDVGLPHSKVFSVAVSAADGTVYAGCEPSMVFKSTDAGSSWVELAALRELPSAPTWSFPPRPWTSHVRWIAPSPHDGALLLVGIELGGVMRSEDGGETWADHRPGAQRDVHSLAWHSIVEGRAYEAGGGGAAWSFDSGATWRPADDGRDRHYTWALAVDPDDPDRWYVSASTGARAAHGDGNPQARLYGWSGAGPWKPLDRGLPSPLDAMPYALTTGSRRVFAGLADGRVFASSDAGDSWEPLEPAGESLPRIQALAHAA